jgi:hypothetical protein
VVGMVFPWLLAALAVGLGAWLGFQLVHQNGRLLARREGLEHRVAELGDRPAPPYWRRERIAFSGLARGGPASPSPRCPARGPGPERSDRLACLLIHQPV